MELGKESKGKLMMNNNTKRQMTIRKDDRDRLSDLPDCVLLHVMKFMDTRDAVRTCVLSKRWKDLWKCLTNLTFRNFRRRIANYSEFVSRVLSGRDGSISLLSIDIEACLDFVMACGSNGDILLKKVMEYVVLHDVPQLTVYINLYSRLRLDYPIPIVFSCPALTFLKLSNSSYRHTFELTQPLRLPALQGLHLERISFIALDNDCAEPFSTCCALNTLVLKDCGLRVGAEVLRISNSNLSSLSLDNAFQKAYKIVLSTPNLSSLAIKDHSCHHQLSSTYNLSFLEEVNIDISYHMDCSTTIISCLQLLANVKRMTLSSLTLETILNDLAPMKIQPPCFVRLESLKIKKNLYQQIYQQIHDEVNRIVEYFLRNSLITKVAVINC